MTNQIKVRGTTVNYDAEGDGIGLLLLHGTGADRNNNFGHLVDDLLPRRTIRPDMSGSGLTRDDGEDLTVDLLVEQVVAAARAETEQPFDIVGLSLGAVVAAASAAKHPSYIRRIVLIAGWSKPNPRQDLAFGLWRWLPNIDLHSAAEYINLIAFSPGFLADRGKDWIEATVNSTAFTAGTLRQVDLDRKLDISADLGRISAPTLVVGCSQDQISPIANSHSLHAAINDSEYVEIDSGHLVVFEKPSELVGAINKFLR